MTCDACQAPVERRIASAGKPYRYLFSGLSNVHLVGIGVKRCLRCRVEVPVIPRMAELHRVIAHALIHKPDLLTGEEVRYLRKFAGYKALDFAERVRVRPDHLSKVENGHLESLGPASDQLVRLLALAAKAEKEQLLGLLTRNRPAGRPLRRLEFRLRRGNRWENSVAA